MLYNAFYHIESTEQRILRTVEDANELFIIEAGKYINSLPDSAVSAIKDNNTKVNTRPVIDFTGIRYEE